MEKKRVLLVWNYDRRDWIQPFLDLREEFEFTFLSKFKSEDDKSIDKTEGIKIIYWTDYASPGAILYAARPQLIVFMSLLNFTDIILNHTARRKGISTSILQHGLFFSQQTYRERAKLLAAKKKDSPPSVAAPKSWQIRYLFEGMIQGFGLRGARALFRYLLAKKKQGDITALENNRFRERLPDKVIVYTKRNAVVFNQRDGIADTAMLEIGNPTLDKYFAGGSSPVPFKSYFLLVDIPLHVERSASSGFGFSREKATDVYRRILEYARSRGKKLVIKLHPFSYNETHLIEGEDVFYTRDEYDAKDLIIHADAVISFPSTLAIPAIYFKPVILLKFAENSFLDFISQAGLPIVSTEEITPSSPDPVWNETARQFVIEECLYKADGKSLQRLQEAMTDMCKE